MDAAISTSAPSPMMQQYLGLKAEAGGALLMFRMGDFYEMFLEDAAVAAAALDIALTHRGQHMGQPLPMCGVPAHSHEAYVARLVKAGHAVAIAEQTEEPAAAKKRGSKAVVSRAIVRVITPGTLTEERLLDSRRANWLLSLFPAPVGTAGETGLAWADISTGEFWLACVPAAAEADEIARIAPAETLRADDANRRRFDSTAARQALEQRFGVRSLDGFGELPRPALAAAGGLLHHIAETARGAPVHLQPPRLMLAGERMAIDASTRRSLELVEGPASLLAAIDTTVTPAGGRLLAAELAAPLADLGAISGRLDLVQWFAADAALREQARDLLRAAPDLSRALGRIAAGRGLPRDLAAMRQALNSAAALRDLLAAAAEQGAPDALKPLVASLAPPLALSDLLNRALAPQPPAERGAAGIIADGFDAGLDELRALQRDSRAAIAALESALRDGSGVQQLRIRHNNVIGYHVEVAMRHADLLMASPDFQHRQTMGNAMRFDTEALRDLATRILQAEARALAAEAAHVEQMEVDVLAQRAALSSLAEALAAIDRSAALADVAARRFWVRPRLTEGREFHIIAGRHPVVEAALRAQGQPFVPNDCRLEAEARLWLVTGPNMGGKSTFLRQNALIAILAQAGSFVPAAEATIGIVDRIYSRVGASDSLAEGRSTFMVEMVETAAILNGASGRSLLLLDEVGRGTATWDGLALAWAILESIHDRIGARCLFATHYHELATLAERLPALALRTMKARQWQGDLVFLHEIAEGAAPGSFGLDVARLAGVPADVLARAGEILHRLETGDAGGRARAALEELPLFAAAAVPAHPKAETADPLRARLAEIYPDSLSPRAALDLLYELKAVAGDGTGLR